MSKIQQLIENYRNRVNTPWEDNISGRERVWFVIYQKEKERMLRYRLERFELITEQAGKKWFREDVTNSFSKWITSQEYCEEYFKNPKSLEFALEQFRENMIQDIIEKLNQPEVDKNSVFAISGVGSLFGFMKVHRLVKEIRKEIPGRLVVFFPGSYENNTYRLMDARDGWDYRAVPITNEKGVLN
jgi:hypothetical protein